MGLGFYAEDTLKGSLPHPPISVAVFLKVEEAVRVAWDRLRNRPRKGFDLVNAVENDVTQELYEVLFDEVFGTGVVAGFDRELFTTVTRDSKVRNFDGSNLHKMPDLLIGLIGRVNVLRNSQDWVFIECKPVDANHPFAIHYCDKGLIRFVRGEYAWAMTSALMVGYAANGYSISPLLSDALKARASVIKTIDSPRACSHSRSTAVSETVQITVHDRTFRYIETDADAPQITIRHLWLRR